MNENQPEISVYRILDAAINRAGEGVRVVEDYLRMVVGDRYLTGTLKQLRHDLTTATSTLDQNQLITARDARLDVGRTIKTETEYQRSSGSSLVQSNLARVQQALRTIEEFSKTVSPAVAVAVEQLRYEAYTIEKAVLTTMLSLESLSDSALYVLMECPLKQSPVNQESHHENPDDSTMPDSTVPDLDLLAKIAGRLIAAGVTLIQLRDKRLTDRGLIDAGKCLSQQVKGTRARWIMNDRTDLALVAGADGVHLGQDDLTVAGARRILGATKLIGVSTHSIDQARQAVLDGANYIGVGPMFPTTTKSFSKFVGTKLAREVAAEIQLPAFAIGGIDATNIEQVVEAGLRRVAVSSAVQGTADPTNAVSELNRLLVG